MYIVYNFNLNISIVNHEKARQLLSMQETLFIYLFIYFFFFFIFC